MLLSAQATDVGVNKATAALFRKVDTPQKMLDLGEEGLKKHIKTIGLFNTKAENVIKTCRMLVELHNGEVPENREALEALPGVGRNELQPGGACRSARAGAVVVGAQLHAAGGHGGGSRGGSSRR